VGQPAIVALADRDLSLRTIGHSFQKQGGPEHLDIHPKLIHVPEADLDVLAFPGFLRRSHLAAELLLEIAHVWGGHGLAGQAADFAVDVPVLPSTLSPGGDDNGPELLLWGVHIVPRVLSFDDMGICIDDRHGVSSSSQLWDVDTSDGKSHRYR
jgi:hypothetical protein